MVVDMPHTRLQILRIYLPADEKDSQWAALNPNAAKQGDATMPDLLKAGHHIGLDTIGQTLRNAQFTTSF